MSPPFHPTLIALHLQGYAKGGLTGHGSPVLQLSLRPGAASACQTHMFWLSQCVRQQSWPGAWAHCLTRTQAHVSGFCIASYSMPHACYPYPLGLQHLLILSQESLQSRLQDVRLQVLPQCR